MQNIGEQVKIEKNEGKTIISIYPKSDKKHLNLLKLWVVAWSICGLLVASQLFYSYQNSEKVFLAIYLSLWFYFEIKTIKALRWNLYGKEVIEVTVDQLIYTELVGSRGIPIIFPKDKIKEVNTINSEEKGFLADINKSIWMMGTESVGIVSKDFSKNIGRKLNNIDASKLVSYLNKCLSKNA